MLLTLPQETILHILSFLDLPDLAALAQANKQLATLTADPVLHHTRLWTITPCRVDHSLFGRDPQGMPWRPTLPELVQRGVMRGLQIERRWRTGDYMYSPHWVKQYENSLRLAQCHTQVILSAHLRRRPVALKSLHDSHVFPDVESSTPSVCRSLLPTVHRLKWSIQKDRLATVLRRSACAAMAANDAGQPHAGNLGVWMERHGRSIFGDSERVRLALCPDVRRLVRFYETATR